MFHCHKQFDLSNLYSKQSQYFAKTVRFKHLILLNVRFRHRTPHQLQHKIDPMWNFHKLDLTLGLVNKISCLQSLYNRTMYHNSRDQRAIQNEKLQPKVAHKIQCFKYFSGLYIRLCPHHSVNMNIFVVKNNIMKLLTCNKKKQKIHNTYL